MSRPLAAAEWRCVMAMMDARDICVLARCSRELRADADAAFVWQHTLVRLERRVSELQQLAAASRFMRHIPLALRWACPVGVGRKFTKLSEQDVHSFLRLPRLTLRELDLTRFQRSEPLLWHRLLASPSLHSLRVLRMHPRGSVNFVDAEMTRMICALPLLHTLEIRAARGPLDVWLPLRTASALTSLVITDSLDGEQARLPIVVDCPLLTDLTVIEPWLHRDPFLAFCATDFARHRLCTLSIDEWYAAGSAWEDRPERLLPADFTAAFSTMAALHTLRLRNVADMFRMLTQLASLPALRSLIVELDELGSLDRLRDATSAPHDVQLAELLRVCPQLHCTILLPWVTPENEGAVRHHYVHALQSPRLTLNVGPN